MSERRAPVRLSRVLPASPDRVYGAWLDPAILAEWISPVGRAVVSLDAKVGGRLRVVMIGEGREIEHVGVFEVLERNRRLVFTWRSPFTGGDSRVTVELHPFARGTQLTLVHDDLPERQRPPHRAGWAAILDRLASVLGGTRWAST